MTPIAIALSALPIVLVIVVTLVRERSLAAASPILACLLSAVLFVPGRYAERLALGLLQAGSEGSAISAAFDLLVVAPLHMGLAVAAFAPFPKKGRRALEVIGLAVSSGLGLAAAQTASLFLDPPVGLDLLPARAGLAIAANTFFAAAWGWAVGVEHERRIRGRKFEVIWLACTAFYALFHNIVFRRPGNALLAAVPIVLAMLVVVGLAAPDVIGEGGRTGRRRTRLATPSIRAMTEAFQHADRALQPRWIAVGALVTSGVVTTSLVTAIVVGRRLALDFTAIDRPDAVGEATAPLLLLGGAVLAAFPLAGWLTTRASAARSVLEAAVASAVAIGALLVLMGLAAPFSVVFAVAFAPIAFGLACLGAWTATTR